MMLRTCLSSLFSLRLLFFRDVLPSRLMPSSETTSINSALYAGYIENGRRYQNTIEKEYFMPSDAKQYETESLTHVVYLILDCQRENPLFRSKLPESATNVLDLGSGSAEVSSHPFFPFCISRRNLDERAGLTYTSGRLQSLRPSRTCTSGAWISAPHPRPGSRRTARWRSMIFPSPGRGTHTSISSTYATSWLLLMRRALRTCTSRLISTCPFPESGVWWWLRRGDSTRG